MTTNRESLPARRSQEEILRPDAEFPLFEMPEIMRDMIELANDNLGGRNFNVLNLPKVRASKSGFFEVETPEGVKAERHLFVLIEAYKQARIYWGRNYNPGQTKEPPACTSADGFTGAGNPGGPCAQCPYARFKSARNPDGSQAAGQACKELRQLLVLLPGQMLPHLLSVQPTSLQGFDKYILTLASSGANFWTVITKLGLEIVPASGYPVARVLFSLSKRLTPDQKQILRPYHERMRDLLTPMVVDASAYEITDAPAPAPPQAQTQNFEFEEEPAPPDEKDANPDDVPF